MQIGTNYNSFNISDHTRVDNNSQKNPDKSSEDKTAQNSKNELTPEDYQKIAKLQARDTEVRAHEMAHQSAGGGFKGDDKRVTDKRVKIKTNPNLII